MDMKNEIKTIIAEDVEIVGTIKCASDIQIDGKLNGDLACTANCVIGATATIKGSLTVESVSVLGTIHGNITARDRIELKATAKVTGDIKAKRLTVEDGVTFVGKSEVNPSGTPTSRPAESTPPSAQPFTPPPVEEKKGSGMFGRK